jgi:membrane protein DedA with SNARE-associated domain
LFGIDPQALQAFALFFGMFIASGMGAPIPEEVAIVCAGLWTAHHPEFGLLRWLMLPTCIFAVVLSDSILYTVGRFYGKRLFNLPLMLRWVPRETQGRILDNFEKYGVNILLFGRLVPGVRMPLFLTAGLLRLSVARFMIADGLGAGLGNSFFFLLAFWFGEKFQEVIENAEGALKKLGPIIILVGLVALAAYLLYKFLRKPVSEGDPEQVPIIGHQVATHIPHAEKKTPVENLFGVPDQELAAGKTDTPA